jgi:cytochrome c-type biogenesis protein CcmH/NrfG
MALSKATVNLLFALVVAALGVTVGISIYSHLERNRIPAQAVESSPLPEKHPPVDNSAQISELQQLIAREPSNANPRTQLGNLYYDGGQYDKAAECYQQSLNLRPRDPSVETDLATCFHYLGQDDRALELLDKVLGYAPDFAQAKFNKGIVLVEGKKDIRGGIAAWEDLLRTDPGYTHKAELQQKINELKASLR